ncbi:MAG: HEAT repeat domain-containing protein [Oligoflexales bacterium]
METRAQLGFGDDSAVINLETSQQPLYITQTKAFVSSQMPGSIISVQEQPSTIYIARHSESVIKSIAVVAVLLGVFFVGFMYLTDEMDFSDFSLFPKEYPGFIKDLLGSSENRIEIQTTPMPEEAVPDATPTEVVPAISDFLVRGGMENPYALIVDENPLPPHPIPMRGFWSSANEEVWRVALKHEFPYQRYKTVRDIRDQRLRGSEELLFAALEEPKFWTRWQALIGLAEFGYEIPHSVVEKAISGQRPSLVNNYFKRFAKTPTPGILYLLRHALSIVNGPGKAIILDILVKTRSVESRLFLVAAHYDQNETVKKWLRESASDLRLTTDDWKRFETAALIKKNEVTEESFDLKKDLPVETTEDPIVDEIKVFNMN